MSRVHPASSRYVAGTFTPKRRFPREVERVKQRPLPATAEDVVLDENRAPRNAERLIQKNPRRFGVMENVAKQRDIEWFLCKRQPASVKQCGRDRRAARAPNFRRDSEDCRTRAQAEHSGEQTVVRVDVRDAAGPLVGSAPAITRARETL
jgi:hypothetical protein